MLFMGRFCVLFARGKVFLIILLSLHYKPKKQKKIMKRYVIRAAKYLAWMLILFAVIFIIMDLTDTSAVEGVSGLKQVISGDRGHILMLMIVALAAVFPVVGFMTRNIKGSLTREDIVIMMNGIGFKLSSYEGNSLVFNATNPLKKFGMYFEDRIEIVLEEENIKVDGIRKEVVKIEYRINTLLLSKERNE